MDFGKKKLKSLQVLSGSKKEGTLQIRLDKPDGPVITEVTIPEGEDRNLSVARLTKFQKVIHNIVVVLEGGNAAELDWIKFIRK